jgi:hypothetical protein
MSALPAQRREPVPRASIPPIGARHQDFLFIVSAPRCLIESRTGAILVSLLLRHNGMSDPHRPMRNARRLPGSRGPAKMPQRKRPTR